jgi:hypothetical protein
MKLSLRNAIAFYTVCSTIAIGIVGIAFKAQEASRAMSVEENPGTAPQDPACTPEARAADEETFFVNCGGFF